MAATRFHHFGSVNFLPDASLAVFFLAGFYMMKKTDAIIKVDNQGKNQLFYPGLAIFSLLIIEAGLIDFVAINNGGVSDWCITPAYLLLIPTYAVMFFAGIGCARHSLFSKAGLGKITAVLLMATTMAFIVSNGSFYLFSGRYAEINGLEYGARISVYYLPYLAYTLLYCGIVITVLAILEKTLLLDINKSGNVHY
jgi:hypothetical protein